MKSSLELAYQLRYENKDSALRIAHMVSNSARQADNSMMAAKAQRTIGLIHELNGNLDSAKTYYQNVLNEVDTSTAESETIGNIYNDWAILHKKIREYQIAKEYHQKTIDLGTRTQNLALQENGWNGLATLYSMLSQFDKSIDYHLKSKQAAEKRGDAEGATLSQTNIANILLKSGNFELAEKNIILAYKMAQRLNSQPRKAAVLKVWANILVSTNKLDEAIIKNLEAQTLYTETGDKAQFAECLISIGNLYYHRGEYTKADSILNECKKLEPIFSKYSQAQFYATLGKVRYAVGDTYSAQKNFELSLEKTDLYGFLEIAKENHLFLGKICSLSNQPLKAYHHSQCLNQIADSLYKKERQHFLSEANFKYNEAETTHQINLQQQALKASKRLTIWLGIALGLSMVFAAYSYWQRQQKQKALSRIELLIKELHHRVKNNLQTLSSIIRVQARSIKDPEMQAVLNETRSRLETVSMLHQQLYLSETTEKHLNIDNFVHNLFEKLCFSYGYQHDDIDKKIDISIGSIHVNRAIPLALILNELLTNSFKHAFQGIERPSISLIIRDNKVHYFDNGVGLNQLGQTSKRAFGTTLIQALVKQMKCKSETYSNNGANFIMHCNFSDLTSPNTEQTTQTKNKLF